MREDIGKLAGILGIAVAIATTVADEGRSSLDDPIHAFKQGFDGV